MGKELKSKTPNGHSLVSPEQFRKVYVAKMLIPSECWMNLDVKVFGGEKRV